MIWRASYTGTNMKNNVTKRTQHKKKKIKENKTPQKLQSFQKAPDIFKCQWHQLQPSQPEHQWDRCSVHRSCTTCHGGQSRRQFHGLHIFPVTWLQDGDSVFCFSFCFVQICDLSVTRLRLYATQIETWSHQYHETWSPVASARTLSS